MRVASHVEAFILARVKVCFVIFFCTLLVSSCRSSLDSIGTSSMRMAGLAFEKMLIALIVAAMLKFLALSAKCISSYTTW